MVRPSRNASSARRALAADSPLGAVSRIRNRAELASFLDANPGSWTLVRTADLENLTSRADVSRDVAMDWPELAAVLREGLQ